MPRLKGHRFRLDLTEVQDQWCAHTAGICRCLWHTELEQRSLAWTHGRHRITYGIQSAELPGLKAAYPWFGEAPHHCLQQTLRDLDTAFQRFFKGQGDYPRFKAKGRRDRFRFPDPKQFVVDEEGQRIKLPKLGWVSYRNGHRRPGTGRPGRGGGRHVLPLAGRIRSITISREGKHWFALILCEQDVVDPLPPAGPAIGVDLGVARPMTLSDGTVVDVAGMGLAERRRLARLQRSLARKKKGSRNRDKARRRLADFQLHMARRRQDAIHQATSRLARGHRLVVIEDLNVKGMTASARGTVEAPGRNVRAKAGLNRAILNVAFGEIRRQLNYKCGWNGSTLLTVPPAYTSQRCSACGHVDAGNRPSQSAFRCLACGHEVNANWNAAINILVAGIGDPAVGQTVAACGGPGVSRPTKQEHPSVNCGNPPPSRHLRYARREDILGGGECQSIHVF